ncbi:MAG: beta-glucuronidase [Oscillospiraceae bacterium]|jgi:hypothetical protein|nr:beta-glucuronidase [Oscillospiraceae bacterium]
MTHCFDLSGTWAFQLGPQSGFPKTPYADTIHLPGTTSYYRKGKKNEKAETDCLTEEYPFAGSAWYSRTFTAAEDYSGESCFLLLERTRITTLWLDGTCLGTQNSLCAPHVYDLADHLTKGEHVFTLCVSNVGYPTKGGHMTSKDTQTNWNGVTGRIELQVFPKNRLSEIQVRPDAAKKEAVITATVCGGQAGTVSISAESFNSIGTHRPEPRVYPAAPGTLRVVFPMGRDALLWSEYQPALYRMKLTFSAGGTADTEEVTFGLRDFRTAGGKFTINGQETFLRGKHEALLFPLTGFAPTSLAAWMEKLERSKEYGINHYRFHTCCPPDAAFTAADLLGVYMEPELPFWGTVPEPDTADKSLREEQDYLEAEGLRMLKAYGSHPSFVMLSLGNELWGSSRRISQVLQNYHAFDSSRLYTQGSNNFQFCPEILPEDDFFCGVRFSRDRLIRGSYGMCDAPLGHVQEEVPGTMKDYDEAIYPEQKAGQKAAAGEKTIQIQFGTGTKTVKAAGKNDMVLPQVPVVSHEVGQYVVFPDFREIAQYTGPLKAKNFEIFQKRLRDKGMGDCAESFFYCSGKLAAQCYQEELEAAFRSQKLAGFQLLDLQDYSGQGTATVGMLNAFMRPKGLISPEKWRSFCSDAVLLARFPKFVYLSGETFRAALQMRCSRPGIPQKLTLFWTLQMGDTLLAHGRQEAESIQNGCCWFGKIACMLPQAAELREVTLSLALPALHLKKIYTVWVCPEKEEPASAVPVFERLDSQLISLLRKGGSALLFADEALPEKTIKTAYCADFWCYPMFRSISESMGKPLPVGTLGLVIDKGHPALRHFSSREYATEPWRSIVTDAPALILDTASPQLHPIVQVIDNFERNHKLSLLFECRVGAGRLLVCSCPKKQLQRTPEGRQLFSSLCEYAASDRFCPTVSLSERELKAFFTASEDWGTA